MKHGSLFSGIGGFDLSAEWMGWENVFNCEINPFCQKVLKYHFPNSKGYADIRSTNFSIHRRKIDILTGGFPCQPFSLAGNRKGTDDDRHLWPEMLRAITEIQPSWVVGENVYGFVNWDGGVVFEQVQTDLENTGYEVTAVILPACAVNAPHRRERCWIIAHRNGIDSNFSIPKREQTTTSENINIAGKNERGVTTNPGLLRQAKSEKPTTGIEQCDKRNVADTNGGIGCERGMHQTRSQKTKQHISACDARDHECQTWNNFPTQSPICSRNDGISDKLDGITFSKWRNESLKAFGNAIVPQIALQIFKAIEKYEQQRHT